MELYLHFPLGLYGFHSDNFAFTHMPSSKSRDHLRGTRILWEDNTITDIKDSFVCGLDLSRLLAVSVWRGT